MVPRPSKSKRPKQASAQIMPDPDTNSFTDIGSSIRSRVNLASDDNEEHDKRAVANSSNLDQVSL